MEHLRQLSPEHSLGMVQEGIPDSLRSLPLLRSVRQNVLREGRGSEALGGGEGGLLSLSLSA